MPEPQDVSPYGPAFVDWVDAVREDFKGPHVLDYISIMLNIMASMRGALYFDEVHEIVHNALAFVEETLQDRGEILAEHWRGMEGGYEMYMATHAYPIPDDLSGLVDQSLPEDYDLRD